jgi:hypothetical protein
MTVPAKFRADSFAVEIRIVGQSRLERFGGAGQCSA